MTPLDSGPRYLLYGRLALRFFLLLLVIIGGYYAVPHLFRLFAPFFFGLLAAVLLNPCVVALERKVGVKRPILSFLLVSLVFLGVVTSLVLLLYLAVREAVLFAEGWEGLLLIFEGASRELEIYLNRFLATLPPVLTKWVALLKEGISTYFQEELPVFLGRASGFFWEHLRKFPSFALSFLIFLMASFFLTAEYPYLRTKFLSSLGEDFRPLFFQIKSSARTAFGGYLRAQFLLSAGVFVILAVGFLVISVPYGVLLALLIACLDFIPLIGAGAVLIPWGVVALLMGDFMLSGQVFFIWALTALFRRIAEPKVMGDQTGLSPLLSLLAIYVGLEVGGVLGMVFAPIFLLIFINLWKIGLFSPFQRDFAMIYQDLSQLLKMRINR